MNVLNYILVDGYNVVNSWEALKPIGGNSLEDSRDKLIDIMHDFSAYKGIRIIVVFDAHLLKGSVEKHELIGEIEIVYTKEYESADCYIERTVVALSKKNIVAVVTADYLEQRIAFQMGAIRITPSEFYNEIISAKSGIREKTKMSYMDKKNPLEDHVNKNILEKLEKMRRNL